MQKAKPKVYKTQKGAKAHIARLQKAWPERKFEMMINPQDQRNWLIALMADDGFRVRAYVGRTYKPMPGEPGHPGFTTWSVELTDLLNGEPNYSWVRKTELEMVTGASRHTLASAFKRAMDLTLREGTTRWNTDLYEFKPYGSSTILLATVVHHVEETVAVTFPTLQPAAE